MSLVRVLAVSLVVMFVTVPSGSAVLDGLPAASVPQPGAPSVASSPPTDAGADPAARAGSPTAGAPVAPHRTWLDSALEPRQPKLWPPAPETPWYDGYAQLAKDPERAGLGAPLAQVVDATLHELDLALASPGTPTAIKNLARLAAQHAAGGPDSAAPVLTRSDATQTQVRHLYRNPTGDDGLDSVWATPFAGMPTLVRAIDLDGDGRDETVVGTDAAVAAFGANLTVLWVNHLGGPVTALFATDRDGDGASEVVAATAWRGMPGRILMLDGRTGATQWELGIDGSWLGAGPASDEPGADILAVDSRGSHYRFTAEGEQVRGSSVELLPSVSLFVAAHFAVGHYLAGFGDLNGDGVADSVSAGLYFDFASVPLVASYFGIYTIVYAVDGATGDLLWLHNEGGEPQDFAMQFLFDLDLLDGRGDGSLDVALAGYGFRYPTAFTGGLYNSYFRVIDGSSLAKGLVLGQRELILPLSWADFVTDLDHADANGDGRDEVVVVRRPALLGGALQVERYQLPPAVINDPALAPALVLPEWGLDVPDMDAWIWSVDEAGGPSLGISTAGMEGGSILVVRGDQVTASASFPWDVAISGAAVGDVVVVGRLGHLEARPLEDAEEVAATYRLRGLPIDLQRADADRDGYADIYVHGYDGRVYLVDGLTGSAHPPIWPDRYAIDFHVADATGDGRPDLFALFADGVVTAFDGASGDELWRMEMESSQWPLVWMDGDADGAPDVVLEDFSEDTLSLISGLDGSRLWSQSLPERFYVWGWEAVKLRGSADDLLLYDYFGESMLALAGDTGKEMWHDPEGLWDVSCGGSMDSDGDGLSEAYFVVVLVDEDGNVAEESVLRRYDARGNSEDYSIGDGRIWICDLAGVESRAAPSLALASLDVVEDVRASVGRFDLAARDWVWREHWLPDADGWIYTPILAGATSQRVATVWRDTVTVHSFADGTEVATFSTGGPIVYRGGLHDLDRRAPHEWVAASLDGFVWALAEDGQGVREKVLDEAAEQGKSIDEEVLGLQDSGDRDTPSVAAGLILVALGLAGAVRRRQR